MFYYVLLCSYANYRTSYRRLKGTSCIAGPGEWVFRQKELMEYFRVRRAGPQGDHSYAALSGSSVLAGLRISRLFP